MQTYGTLYGIGVGPGDPDLLTLAAIKALGQAQVVLTPSSGKPAPAIVTGLAEKQYYSIALGIAAPHLPKDAATIRLHCPMTSDTQILEAAWQSNLEITLSILHEGKNAAFITLGDPLIYSTFGYLLTRLRREQPQIRVEVVPGITSFQAAAARTRTILCEGDQNLLIIPAIRSQTDLTADLRLADNAVILKAGRNLPTIKESLQESLQTESAQADKPVADKSAAEPDTTAAYPHQYIFASRLGLDGELLCPGLENLPEHPDYLSLILATWKR